MNLNSAGSQKARSEKYDLLFLDEIIYTIRAGLFDETLLLSWLREKPEELEVGLTGQDPSPRLVRSAHYARDPQKKTPL